MTNMQLYELFSRCLNYGNCFDQDRIIVMQQQMSYHSHNKSVQSLLVHVTRLHRQKLDILIEDVQSAVTRSLILLLCEEITSCVDLYIIHAGINITNLTNVPSLLILEETGFNICHKHVLINLDQSYMRSYIKCTRHFQLTSFRRQRIIMYTTLHYLFILNLSKQNHTPINQHTTLCLHNINAICGFAWHMS